MAEEGGAVAEGEGGGVRWNARLLDGIQHLNQQIANSADNDSVLRSRRWFGAFYVLTVVLLNVAAVVVAWHDRSWIAFGIATIYGPALNGLLALISICAYPILRRSGESSSLWLHVLICLSAPIAAIVLNCFIIFSMDLHGC